MNSLDKKNPELFRAFIICRTLLAIKKPSCLFLNFSNFMTR